MVALNRSGRSAVAPCFEQCLQIAEDFLMRLKRSHGGLSR